MPTRAGSKGEENPSALPHVFAKLEHPRLPIERAITASA
jgi:hypothetical protein